MTDSVSEELVERVARVIDPDIWHDRAQTLLAWKVDTFGDAPFPYSGQQQIDLSLARARAVLAAFPDISSLQGDLKDALVAAYEEGATAVHDYLVEAYGLPENDPDFKEAAYDYAADVLSASLGGGEKEKESDQ